MNQLLVRSGQLIEKQEEPTHWITIEGGKRIPITEPHASKPRAKKKRFNSKEQKAWRGKKREESKQLLSVVDELVDAINSPAGDRTIEAWLDQQAKFWQYSWTNTILVLVQKPDARRVAGYRQWQKLGRQVRQGEKSIRILAPFSYKTKQEPVEGDEAGEEKVSYRTYFNPVSVFDVSQTDGEELLDFRPSLGPEGEELLQAARSYAEEEEVPLQFGPIYGAAGAFIGTEGITVYEGLGVSHQAISLVHELAHRQLQHLESKVPTSQAEAEAEATTFIVLKALGLPAQASNSAGYIKSHFQSAQNGESKGTPSERIKSSLSRISASAKVLIDGLSSRLGEGEPTDPEDDPTVIKLYDPGMSTASVQHGGLIIKRDGQDPVRWITTGGKRIPITPKKEQVGEFDPESEDQWIEIEPDPEFEQMGLVATASPAYQRLSDMVYEKHPLGDQEPDKPAIFEYDTVAELETARSWYSSRGRLPPSGWYSYGSHEIHLSSPNCLSERFPGKTRGEYQQYWIHVAAHETMHSTGLGWNLKNPARSWGEALTEIATRRFLDKNFYDMGAIVRERGPYQGEINGLVLILTAAADGDIEQASELLGEILAAGERSSYNLAWKIGEIYRNWSMEHQDMYPDGPLVREIGSVWSYANDSDIGFDILKDSDYLWDWGNAVAYSIDDDIVNLGNINNVVLGQEESRESPFTFTGESAERWGESA